MPETPSEQIKDSAIFEQQVSKASDSCVDRTEKSTIFQQFLKRSHLEITGLILIVLLVIGYLLFKSQQSDLVSEEPLSDSVTPSVTLQISATPNVITNTPTTSASTSQSPTIKPVVTKNPLLPTSTPKLIQGVDLRFVDLHFYYPKPEPNTAYTPYRVVNGGSITVENKTHDGEFSLTTVLVNNGTDDSGTVWIHYYVDDTEINKGIAFLPGNMVVDELVTRDSASPVKIPASGTHKVKIVIDPDNQSKDVNLTNNTYTFTYSVQ